MGSAVEPLASKVQVSPEQLNMKSATGGHVTAKVVVVAPPDGTVTVCGFAPLSAQFGVTPESATVWWVGSSAAKVTLPFGRIAWPGPPSTAAV